MVFIRGDVVHSGGIPHEGKKHPRLQTRAFPVGENNEVVDSAHETHHNQWVHKFFVHGSWQKAFKENNESIQVQAARKSNRIAKKKQK